MKICGCNCRGLGKSSAVGALVDLHKRLKPDVFFLSETHLTKARAGTVRRKLGYDHMIESESDGRSGGLLMLWNNNIKVTSSTAHTNYLDIVLMRIRMRAGELRGSMENLVEIENIYHGTI
jgi:hypothetical protein